MERERERERGPDLRRDDEDPSRKVIIRIQCERRRKPGKKMEIIDKFSIKTPIGPFEVNEAPRLVHGRVTETIIRMS